MNICDTSGVFWAFFSAGVPATNSFSFPSTSKPPGAARSYGQATGVSMSEPEEAIRPLRQALEQIHARLGQIIARLLKEEDRRCLCWRCTQCGYRKRFTRPMPAQVAAPCPKCRSESFEAIP